MKCQEFPLDDFVDGLLDAEGEATVAAHLEECPTCAALVEALGETRSLLRQTEPVVVSRRFERRLKRRLDRADLKREGLELLALGLAAVVALLRLLLAWPGSRGAPAASTSSDKEGRRINL
jgi:anti-sigma factor RsiW